jgi:hypothetical protein
MLVRAVAGGARLMSPSPHGTEIHRPPQCLVCVAHEGQRGLARHGDAIVRWRARAAQTRRTSLCDHPARELLRVSAPSIHARWLRPPSTRELARTVATFRQENMS